MTYQDSWTSIYGEAERRTALLPRVFGLLAFSFAFTAVGAMVGVRVGPGILLPAVLVTLGCIIALTFVRDRMPLNLILFYGFSVAEGTVLGLILESYLVRGQGGIVLEAAGLTAGLSLVLGGYAWTTKRDLSGLGGYLFAGLIAVVLASVVGIFLRLPLFHVVLSGITALLFCGFILYDVQRLRTAEPTFGNAVLIAVSLYLDLLNLFLSLLYLLSALSGNDRD